MALHRAGGLANLKDLGLTRNQWDNFQKLRYFGLVIQYRERGIRQAGVWEVTEKGSDFVRGHKPCRKGAWTFRGEVERFDGPLVFIADVSGGYVYREEWAAGSMVHE